MHNNSGVNKVFLIGRVDTELQKYTGINQANMLYFTLITDEKISKGANIYDHTELHHLAVDAEHPDIKNVQLTKNTLLYITGKIQTTMKIDEDRVKRYQTNILVVQLQLL